MSTAMEVMYIADKKLGRPFSPNPKSTKLTVRIDERETKILDDYCEQKNKTRADGVRDAIRDLENKK